MPDAPRQGLGSFFRALMDFVDDRGLREQVRAAVPPATRATIDTPPRSLSFVASTPIDDIETALQKIAGDETLVECGIAFARPLGWTMLQPVIRMAFMLFGQSPEPIFSNLDRFFSMATHAAHRTIGADSWLPKNPSCSASIWAPPTPVWPTSGTRSRAWCRATKAR